MVLIDWTKEHDIIYFKLFSVSDYPEELTLKSSGKLLENYNIALGKSLQNKNIVFCLNFYIYRKSNHMIK